MSFAICVCGSYFSIIMTDGRMIRLSDNVIVNEMASKAIKINENVILGVTGDPMPVEIAINNLRNYDYECLFVPEMRNVLIENIKQFNINHLGVNIIISGRDSNGRFLVDTINSKQDYISNPIYPEGNNLVYTYAGNDEELCDYIVSSNLNNKKFYRLEGLEEFMKKCIFDVAEHDPTVNTNIFKVVIL